MKTNKLSNQLLVIVILVIITSCERAEVAPDLKLKGNVVETLADEEETGIVHAGSVRGSLDGSALQAQFDSPVFLAVGPDNSIYVYDAGRHFEIGFNDQNRKIRKISTSGIVTTVFDLTVAGFAGGIGGMAIEKDGSIYVSHQNQIKKIKKNENNVSIVAGTGEGAEVAMKDGPSSKATFLNPGGLAFNNEGCLIIMDSGNNAVRKLSNNKVTTIAGGNRFYDPDAGLPQDGSGAAATFDNPHFLAIDNQDNIYLTGGSNSIIRKVTPTGVVTTLVPASRVYDSDFYFTFTGIAFANNGKLYVNKNDANGKGAPFSFSINELTLSGVLTPLANNQYFDAVEEEIFTDGNHHGLLFPTGVVTIGDTLYFANTDEHRIRKFKID